MAPAEEGWESHHVGPVGQPGLGDESVDACHYCLERGAAPIDSGDVGRQEKPGLEEVAQELGVGPVDCQFHVGRVSQGSRWTRRRDALTPRMRSFAIMTPALKASRRWRPRL